MSKKLKVQLVMVLFFAATAFMLWQNALTPAEAGKHQETLTGTLFVNWIDPVPSSVLPAQVEFYLRRDDGEYIRLALNEADIEQMGGITRLTNQRIRIAFDESLQQNLSKKTPIIVESIEMVNDERDATRSNAASLGNKKFANILCRFSDAPEEPIKPSYYDNLFRETYPGLGDYWREVSYNQMNVEGSVAVGWYVLPYSQTTYNTFDFARDCAQAADADVYFPDFFGINFIINADLRPGYGGEAGTYVSSLDGVTRTYGVTWIYRPGIEHQGLVAHEMGHTFGLSHSSGGHGSDYDSLWDVMSYSYSSPPIPGFGSAGEHTISAYKDKLGWIPEERQFIAPPNGANDIVISPLAPGPVGRSVLMAKIPTQENGVYYTVESRTLTGYDQYLPAQAIVIHKYNGSSATVVDNDVRNTNPNDAGAQWTVGETFLDTANHIRVTVNSEEYGFYNVTIERNVGCTFSLSSAGANFSGAGGNGSVEVVTQPGCAWSVNGAAEYRRFAANGFQIYDAPPRSSLVGLAEHYPSTVTVGGISGAATKVRVQVNRLGHASPGDVDMLLVSPNGTATMLMSDADASLGPPNTPLIFDQFAAAPLSQSGTNPSGTYLPTNYGSASDTFPLPGPGSGSFAANLNLFNGSSANGDWKLFVVDDTNGGTGSLDEWLLEVTDSPVVAERISGFGTATINYAVTTNYSRPRVLTLSIGGQTFTISQM